MEDEEETGFNLDDVLNPKGELDLAKLCRGLGLMDDPEESGAQEPSEPQPTGSQAEPQPSPRTKTVIINRSRPQNKS